MNFLNLKNVALAVTLLTSATSFAGSLKFDPDGAAGGYHSPELVSQLSLAPEAVSNVIVQNLGADGVLSNGDTFTEFLTYKVPTALFFGSGTSSIFGDTSAINDYTQGFFRLTLNLEGHIDNYVGGPVTGSDGASQGAFLGSSFDVIFDFADKAISLDWFDGDGVTVNNIAVWDVLSGGAGGVDAGGTVTQNFEFSLAFDESTPAGYWSDYYDKPIHDFIAINQAFGIADADANLQGVVGGAGGVNGDILIAASQNPTALRFAVPEPTSLAILGLGLLGLAGARRRA